ncbi:MAG: phage portal protein family protein [Bacteroidales bacterium]
MAEKKLIKRNTQASREPLKRLLSMKSMSIMRKDMATWKAALQQATNTDNPKQLKLIHHYNDVMDDLLMDSQMDNRFQMTKGSDFELLDKSKKVNEEATELLKQAVWLPELIGHILDSINYGHSLVDFSLLHNGQLKVDLIPRENVIQRKGLLLYNSSDDKGLLYRNEKEYGTWWLEFGKEDDLGKLRKAVPVAMFKKFAQSCWAELCEIYGIPPRYLKTDTRDPDMMNAAQSMMRDMGSAAWWIIDNEEELQFANSVGGNGDIYNNFIGHCNSELSLFASGAILGQDTKNGNRSKEEVSFKQLKERVKSDKKYVEDYMNSTVMPALYRIGLIQEGLIFKFNQEEDLEALWKMVTEASQHYEVDPKWISEKFGIKILGKRSSTANLSVESFFE